MWRFSSSWPVAVEEIHLPETERKMKIRPGLCYNSSIFHMCFPLEKTDTGHPEQCGLQKLARRGHGQEKKMHLMVNRPQIGTVYRWCQQKGNVLGQFLSRREGDDSWKDVGYSLRVEIRLEAINLYSHTYAGPNGLGFWITRWRMRRMDTGLLNLSLLICKASVPSSSLFLWLSSGLGWLLHLGTCSCPL